MEESVLRVDGGRLTEAGAECVAYASAARERVRAGRLTGQEAGVALAAAGLAAGPALLAALSAWARAAEHGGAALAGFGTGLGRAAHAFAQLDEGLAGRPSHGLAAGPSP